MNPNLAKACRPEEIPVVLKPSSEAFKIAVAVANVDPRHTVCRFTPFYNFFFAIFMSFYISLTTRFLAIFAVVC